jgi:ABC-2 type transport system ATP-binding protein
MITVENLLKKFGNTTAVDIDYLKINRGEIFGLVGNNGAGKTTFLRLLLDLLKPEKGKVLSKSEPVYQSDHWKSYTGSYIDTNFLIEFLKPEEYFDFIGSLYELKDDELQQRLKSFIPFMNGEIIEQKKYIRNLSTGNQHKTGIIGALISKPEVLVLDEPFNFLDPSSQIILKQLLKRLQDDNICTMIISSHNLNHISDICTRICLLEKGKIILDLKNDEQAMVKVETYFNSQISQKFD